MGIFDLFAPKNPFNKLSNKVERLRALLSIMKQEAHREYFMQLKGHLQAVQRLVGHKDALDSSCIIRLLMEEERKIEEFSSSDDKLKLVTYKKEIQEAFIAIVQTLQDAIPLCDSAIASRQNPQELQKYKQEIEKRVIFLEKLLQEVLKRAPIMEKLYQIIQNPMVIEIPESIPFSGRMSNGFTGTNIQKVIRQLGGYIIASRGRHPYKIVFPGKGQMGFSFTMSPSAFLKEVSHLVGVGQKALETAFRLGALVR